MKTPKKILITAIVSIFILVLLTACGGDNNALTDINSGQSAQTSSEDAIHTNWGDFGITIQSGEVRIRNWSGDAAELIIPAEIEGLPVTEIGHNSFSVHDDDVSPVTSLVIPDSVRRIENFAFRGVQLRSLVLGNNVEYIGNSAFARHALSSLVIPDSVVTIGSSAFIGGGTLQTLTIGSGVTHIGAQAFNETGLTALHIPDNVVYIGSNAFGGSVGLTSIVIGSGVEYIGARAFHGGFNARVEIMAEVEYIAENAFNQRAAIVFPNRHEVAMTEPETTLPEDNEPLVGEEDVSMTATDAITAIDPALVGRWEITGMPSDYSLGLTPFEQEMRSFTRGVRMEILQLDPTGVATFYVYLPKGSGISVTSTQWTAENGILTLASDFLWGRYSWEYSFDEITAFDESFLNLLDTQENEQGRREVWRLRKNYPGSPMYVYDWQRGFYEVRPQIIEIMPAELLGTWASRQRDSAIHFHEDTTMVWHAYANPNNVFLRGSFTVDAPHNHPGNNIGIGRIIFASAEGEPNFATIFAYTLNGDILTLQDMVQGNPVIYFDRRTP